MAICYEKKRCKNFLRHSWTSFDNILWKSGLCAEKQDISNYCFIIFQNLYFSFLYFLNW